MSNTFDPVAHEYRMDSEVVPSVTEIVSPLIDYSMVPADRLNFARDRGTAVHLACHLDDIGDLDEESVDMVNVWPYLLAWRRFKTEHKVKVKLSEEPLFHGALRFAGTPDKVLLLGKHRMLPDLKTVAKMTPAIGVQLSGYEALVSRNKRWQIHSRVGIQLRRDGTYNATTYPDELGTFMSLLNLYNWRKKNV